MPSVKRTHGAPPPPPSALPRKLRALTARTEVLERTEAGRLLAVSSSRRPISLPPQVSSAVPTGEALPREAIAALYSLATRLHSPGIAFHAKTIETSADKHVTVDQIWGQMSVLLRPVLRRLQDNVRRVERVYGKGADAGGKAKAAVPSGGAISSSGGDTVKDKGEASGEAEREDVPDDGLESLSGDSEDHLDAAITALLEEQKRRKMAKARKRKGSNGEGGDDSWRYAFGKGGAEEDEDSEGMDGGEGSDHWGDGEDAHGDDADDVDGRMTDRNARAMRAAADHENEEEEEEEGGDAEEELAALKEMYGEDFEDDGEGLMGGEEEDPDLEKDLFYDDPNRDDDDAEEAEEDMLYKEERDGARFWGKDDMLNEDEALHSYGGGDEDGRRTDPTARAGLVDGAELYDEELERALADPNLTELERERLLEKKHIEKLEQQRLFGTDWAMAGETAAMHRPREALLDADGLEFDYGLKAVPVVTEAFTAKLEERIRRRIVEKRYDDVQRRTTFTTADDLVTTRKDAVLDSEKSKLSLMDLYEKEYTEKMRMAEEAAGGGAATAEPLTEIERDELRAINMWKRLSQHLDALSNFYYTPKPVQQDLEARVRAVDGAMPAIALESVGHFAASRESALAPQDLYRGSTRNTTNIGSEEMNPQERRRLRRAKKEESSKAAKRTEHRRQERKAREGAAKKDTEG